MSATYPTALITGASGGIGEAYAHELARRGSDLVLVARSRERLQALARGLSTEHGRRVEVIAADLSQPHPGAALAAEVAARGLTVDLLINNAGFGTAGAFHRLDGEREQQAIALNCAALVDLSHSFLGGMADRGRGAVINVASLAGLQPMPYMAVYGATKAFVISFSQALQGEYRKQGIRVQALCPGPVDTGFFEATGNTTMRGSIPRVFIMSAERVVRISLDALERGSGVVVPGLQGQVMGWLNRMTPKSLAAAALSRIAAP